MKSTMQYSVGGQIFDVADDRRDEFFADAANDFDEAPEEVITFWVNGSPVQVKASRVDEFMADCEADGVTPKRTRNFRMDDGEMLRLGDDDVRQFVNARRTGQTMSRGLLKQTGIPEHYGRSASDREALADVMAAYYPEDTVDPQYLDRGRNLGDAVSEGAGAVGRAANEVMLAPGSASREWMDRGAENGEYLPTAVKNVNAYAGKVASGIANLLPAATDVVGQVLGGESTAAGRYMRQSANAGRQAVSDNIDTELPEYETGSELGNAVLNKANEFVGDTGATLVKFAIPGAAAVEISANAANTYYDAYQKAMANGADDRKAEALAAAAAGVGAVEGIILAQSANGSGGANGFIKRVLEVAGKMGGAATARDVVQQGIEGEESPDVGRAVAEGAKGAAEGAAFEAMSGAVHGARNRLAGRTGDYGEARFREEQAKNDSREAKRDVARETYDRSISEEAAWQLDREIQEQVDAGTISDQAKDRVKARVIGLYDSARSLDDPKLREGALMKAVTEENTRRETPARVTSDAHERRLVEERMRENEYWARRSDELVTEFGKEEAARKLAEEQAKSDMRKADELADSNARQQRERELQEAFKTETPAITARDAAKILGVDAYDKSELTRKLSQWEASPTDANAKHRAAAKVMLARLEGPRKKPVVDTQEHAVATRKPDGKDKIVSVRPVENVSVSRPETDEPTQKLPATPTTTPTAAAKSTDAGFAAWAKGIDFANDAERKQSRDLFDSLVRRGKVNGETGQRMEPGETTGTVTPSEPVPAEKTSSVARAKQPTALAAANAEAKTAAAMRLAKMETADLQDQRGALLAAKEAGDTSKRTANQIISIEQELARRSAPLEQKAEGDVYMRNLDPNLRSDTKVVDWARKQGRAVPTDERSGKPTVDIETMREYNRNRAMNAAKIVKRAFPGMEVTYHDKPDGVERGQHDIDLRDRHGRSLGWFSPSRNKVALLPGSDAETVAHEIGWHAARHWATTEANNGNVKARKMLDAMHDVENNVPSGLRSKVLHLYRSAKGYSRDDLLNEFGAWDFMTTGGKDLERALESREAQKWYGKAVTTMKDTWKDFASAHGMNRVELEKIDGMGIEQFKNFISRQLVEGKTFGELKTPGDKPIDLDETLKGKYLRKVYDVNAPLQEIVRRVEKKTGRKMASDDSIADENARKVGYQEAAQIAFKNRLSGFRDILRETGLSQEQVGYYMACKAAEGRDAKIDRRNMDALVEKSRKLAANEIHDTEISNGTELTSAQKKAIYDRHATEAVRNYVSTNGSGIRPAEARKTIDELERGSMGAEYKRAARYLREVVNETLKEQRDQGLVGADEYARWTSEEPEYVPFKSTIDSATGEYVGRSMDLGGFEHKTAKGRKTAADDIVGHIFEDFQVTRMRSVENGVRQKLAKLVRDNPELGTVEKVGGQSISERKLGDSVKTSDGGRDNVVLFKEDGVPMVITLNGELGRQAAAAITGRNRSHMPEWFRKTTRAFASMATEHSPTFSVRNFQKDQLALAEIVLAERGAKDGARFMGNYASAQKDIHGALWKFVTTGDVDASTKGGRILQDYIDAGGMIGGYEKETLGEISKALSYDEIRKSLKSGKNFAKAVGRHTLNSVAYLNKISELTSRVGTFEAERRMGTDKDGNAVTDKSAALYSRRALVDFNQGGENTGVTNALKMFSNSGIGANMRAVQAMMGNRNGAGLLAAMITWGASQAVLNHVMNPDDDKREREGLSTNKDIGEHELRTGFAFFRRGDKAFKIGQHEDVFTLASYFGNTLARCVMGDIGKEQAAKNLGVSVAELATVFSGLGDANLDSRDGDAAGVAKAVALYLTPSMAQPIGEIALNQDYAGRELYVPKNRSESAPSYQKARKSTPGYAVTASEWLNGKSGGNSARAGKIDIPPEVIQKLVEGYGKNALKDVMNIYETGKAIMNGEYGNLEPNLKPFARDFVKKVPDSTNRYYTRKAEVADDFDEWRKLKDGMTADERRKYLEEHPWVREKDKINNIEDRIQTLSKKEQGLVKKGRSWVEMEREPTDGQIDNWKRMRLRLQAKMLERTKKR